MRTILPAGGPWHDRAMKRHWVGFAIVAVLVLVAALFAQTMSRLYGLHTPAQTPQAVVNPAVATRATNPQAPLNPAVSIAPPTVSNVASTASATAPAGAAATAPASTAAPAPAPAALPVSPSGSAPTAVPVAPPAAVPARAGSSTAASSAPAATSAGSTPRAPAAQASTSLSAAQQREAQCRSLVQYLQQLTEASASADPGRLQWLEDQRAVTRERRAELRC